ncbi:putative mercuric reductase [Aspergillus floccosus]
MLSNIVLGVKLLGALFSLLPKKLHLLLAQRIHRLTYRAVEHPRNVVVIGASFAGYHVARCLANSLPTGYQVVVIEKHSHFRLTWVLPRFSVVPGHAHKAFIPYGPYLDSAPAGSYKWINDTVETIIPNKDGNGMVELASGQSVDYEYLVIATGASAGLPSRVPALDKQGGMEMLQVEQEKLQDAKDVVIVGGGSVGVELAADAKERYPDKNVTLVHSRDRLLNARFGPKLGEAALKELTELGVNVRLGERVVKGDSLPAVELRSGESIPCDYFVNCVGQRPNSGLIEALSAESVSESGHIKVQPTLQIAGSLFARTYAAGDVIESDGVKNARGAIEQAEVVAKNIVRAMHSQKQIEYHVRWWEGMTQLSLGLNKTMVWMSDGSTEVTMAMKSTREDMESAEVWKYFGLKPFEEKGYL